MKKSSIGMLVAVFLVSYAIILFAAETKDVTPAGKLKAGAGGSTGGTISVYDPCQGVSCDKDSHCVRGECIDKDKDCSKDSHCGKGKQCNNGTCISSGDKDKDKDKD